MNIEELSELFGNVSLQRSGGGWFAYTWRAGKQYDGSGPTSADAIDALLKEARADATEEVEKSKPWQELLQRIDAAQAPRPGLELTEYERGTVGRIREIIESLRRNGETVICVEVPLYALRSSEVLGVPVYVDGPAKQITAHTNIGRHRYPINKP